MRAPLLFTAILLTSCHRGLPDDGGMVPNTGLHAAKLSGKVLDRTTGRGIERASITVTPRGGDLGGQSAVTGPGGDYQISPIAPGDYDVEFAARGFQSQSSTLRFRPGQSAARNVSLSPASTVVCPQSRTGRPIPGCG